MEHDKNNTSPVINLTIDGYSVTVQFSEEESVNVKDAVRSILTDSCMDRIEQSVS